MPIIKKYQRGALALPFLLLWISTSSAAMDAKMQHIGELVFQNECASHIACLTSWNEGENFASLGIGHFIWYPSAEEDRPFDESFPNMIRWMQKQGIDVPMLLQGGNPWQNRQNFLAMMTSPEMQQIRSFLQSTMDMQVMFMQQRLDQALPKMLAALSSETQKTSVRQRYQRVLATAVGSYILLDYVNFKGEGVTLSERYQGKGWGLLQVLMGMKSSAGDDLEVVTNFVDSAKKVLQQRVYLSPTARGERRWLAGWEKRLDTYIQETRLASRPIQGSLK